MILRNNRRGELLVGNIVFILLNLIFLSILVIFLIQRSSAGSILEESYAKRIALLVDSSQPEMQIQIDMGKGLKIVEKNGLSFDKVVTWKDNVVNVRLGEGQGYSYSFFNDVDFGAYPDRDEDHEYTGMYILTIVEKGLEVEDVEMYTRC